MTKQIVNIGETANDRNADSLRSAFLKINDNFTELYTELGLISDTTLNLGAFEFTGSTMSTTDSTPIVIDQSVTVSSDLTLGGDLLPSRDLGGNLGSPTQQWKSLYVSTNTIYINNVPLSLDNSNNLTVNGSPVNAVGSAAWSAITGKPTFATVATSGAYSDLSGRPTIPTNTNELTNGAGFITSTDRLSASGDEVVLTGGANPYVTFPAITGGDQLQIVGAEVSTISGNLALTSVTDTNIISNGSGTEPGGSKTWTFSANGELTVPGAILPSTDNLQDLGTSANRFRHVYVGPGSVYIGNNVITESATGGLVLPGVTRATGYYAEEVENEDRWGSNPTITGTVTVIDATRYQILAGQSPSAGYNPATYTVQKDGNRVEEINVSSGGSGWTKAEADYARDNNMYATNVAGAINNFNAGNWQQIPFRVEIKAEDTEYEDIFGGNADLGDLVIENSNISSDGSQNFVNFDVNSEGWMRLGTFGNEKLQLVVDYDDDRHIWEFGTNGNLKLPAGGDIVNSNGDSVLGGGNSNTGDITFTNDEIGSTTNVVNINASDYAQLQSNDSYVWVDSTGAYVQIGSKTFEFDVRGSLRLPADGDIIDSNGDSVLGGGSNSYTPDDTDNWDSPTVNTIAAALDELAAKVAALQNFEIDGGNANTPAAGELLIDGNGA